MKDKHIFFFIGTTAEFIKLSPIIKELNKRKIVYKIITSGQNRINFEELEDFTGKLKVDIALTEKASKSSIPLFLLWTLKTLFTGFLLLGKPFKNLNKNNSYFIVHGDTVSSLIGSLIAKRYSLKLIHIESGLRSYNFFEPFPEEICRFINIHLADVLFAPTDWAFNNTEGFKKVRINTKQNTLIEPYLWSLTQKQTNYKKMFNKYYIVIMHRQEHVYFQKEWTRKTLDLLINNATKNLKCIFIMHALTSRFLESERLNTSDEIKQRLILLPTLPYKNFMNLMSDAEFIATDGCTNQEESYYMGLPMIALRSLTERIEGLGENVVISQSSEKIINNFLKKYKKNRRKPIRIKFRPSKIIVDYLNQDV